MPIKFNVLNYWSGSIQFTAAIDCEEDASTEIKLGLSVKWAVMTGASLVGASLDGASLDGASLVRARLDGASLDGASLVRARLDGARLDGARLDGASLVRASLDGASLVGASLDGASLDGARLDGARLDGASLDGANLIVGGQRSDGYRFLAFRERDNAVKVRAGCRYFTISEARTHWTVTRRGTRLGEESLALVDDLERRARIAGWFETATSQAAAE